MRVRLLERSWVMVALAALASCTVSFPEDLPYGCASDADCGGGGYVCNAGACCLPDAEICDGRDNDCNGQVDDHQPPACYPGPEGTGGVGVCKSGLLPCAAGAVGACAGAVVPGTESCNGLDDDCDGAADEDFDLQKDDANCGQCGRACTVTQACRAGECAVVAETSCEDATDNEGDGKVDCADDDCGNQPCGAGCVCTALRKSEAACGDGQDNDGDSQSDCSDPDCADGGSCGAGCVCAGGTRKETGCRDAIDNDGDGKFDCVDGDCSDQLCKPGAFTFACGDAGTCLCRGVPNPPQESNCTDAVDNDCNGQTDCADNGCVNFSVDAGWGCRLGQKAELVCTDLADNDGDGRIDCLDAVDCPSGAACKYRQGGNLRDGKCLADGGCR